MTNFTDRTIAEALGEKAMIIAMEECAELIQAISKTLRGIEGDHIRDNLVEEVADVLNAIEYIKAYSNITEEEIEKWREYKTERTINKWRKGELK